MIKLLRYLFDMFYTPPFRDLIGTFNQSEKPFNQKHNSSTITLHPAQKPLTLSGNYDNSQDRNTKPHIKPNIINLPNYLYSRQVKYYKMLHNF